MLSWKLFLDDERFPASLDDDIFIARDVSAAIELINEMGCPSYIDFDHDLGAGPNAFDFVKWLVGKDIEEDGKFIPLNFDFSVHSQNPVGAKNIREYLWSYLTFRRKNS